MSEPSDQRRGMAVEHQASAVFDPRTQDVVAEVLKATDGQGADVVFDCAGSSCMPQTFLEVVFDHTGSGCAYRTSLEVVFIREDFSLVATG